MESFVVEDKFKMGVLLIWEPVEVLEDGGAMCSAERVRVHLGSNSALGHLEVLRCDISVSQWLIFAHFISVTGAFFVTP